MSDLSCHDSAMHEPLAGTAPNRRVWLIIEQPGTWGENALLESSLPVGLGERLIAEIVAPEVGVLLARRPDIAAQERRTSNRRRIWLAHTSPSGVRMRAGSLDDVREVLKFDWAAIKRGELPPLGRRSADPALFICTNGKRDMCCAVEGRKVIDELRTDKELTGQIYELSHIGGHRFAPTGLLLPWGYVLGRLDADDVRAILSEAWDNRLNADYLRGRSALPTWAQVAEIAVRAKVPNLGIDSLDVLVNRGGKVLPWTMAAVIDELDLVEVRHLDGRAWRVEVALAQTAPRKISCGGELESGSAWQVNSVLELNNWH
ncbi:MAG: hypothetical protein RL038_992 [Actinomycetota bacterium]